MVSENLAAIDLGTNACRIMVVDGNGSLLYRNSLSTKLGEGMYANMCFTNEAIDRGLCAFSEYAKILEKYDVKKYRAIATASCRMATNGMYFVKKVAETTGIKIDVIDGHQEAKNAIGTDITSAHGQETTRNDRALYTDVCQEISPKTDGITAINTAKAVTLGV